MNRFATTWLGLELRSPLVASSSPLTGELDSLVALVDAGVGAVVLPSLFEEQIVHESEQLHRMLDATAATNPEAADGYFPELDEYNTGPEHYLAHVEAAAAAVDVPVVASLNGASPGGWVGHAAALQDAGAAAIELNVYRISGDVHDDPRQVEDELVELVASVVDAVTVPVNVKMTPFWSALGAISSRVVDAGAAGLSLFNRFFNPDIDIDTRDVTPRLLLSAPDDLLLPLRWTGILYGRIDASLAITSGVHECDGLAKALLAGADVAMMASALLKHGPGLVPEVLDHLLRWMDEQEYESVAQLRGSASQRAVRDPDAYLRANYLQTLSAWASPIGRLV